MLAFKIYTLQRLLLRKEKKNKRERQYIGEQKHNLFIDKETAREAAGKGHLSSQ